MNYRAMNLLSKLQTAFNDDDAEEAFKITKELLMHLHWTGVDYV